MQIDRVRRFFAKIDAPSEFECWEWTSCLRDGYGMFSSEFKGSGAKMVNSHRVMWDIPKDKFVLHKCDNRKCCNPGHLYLGTKKDNAIDMMERRRHNCLKLTKAQVEDIKSRSSCQGVLAKEFGVSRSTISRVIGKKTHTYLYRSKRSASYGR